MRKILSNLYVFIIIVILIIIGYYTYQSYMNKINSDDESVELNNYYDAEYLFNSGYIKKANTIDSNESISISYTDSTMIIKYANYSKQINNVPSKEDTVYYNKLYDNYYEFLIVKDDSIYYACVDITDNNESSFSVINKKISEVYVSVYDKDVVFVNKTDKITTNFILADSKQKLYYIDYDNNKYVLKSDIENKKPYFDYICASDEISVCNSLMVYITFNKELVYDDNNIRYNNKRIYIKDVFSSLEIETDKTIDFNTITMNELEKNKYSFKNYIIDKAGILYVFEISNNASNISKINNGSNKVKEYIYDNKDDVSKLIIVFKDGTREEIQSSNNKVINDSTIYDKTNNNEKVLTP